ncbi:hypothetical protein [Bacillus xiapuensis]|uniref:DNA-binding protein n=1 Tax=Bacillus xiapuensis TaxID=2014075 RepID=A0ABU6NB71_9BACI|nr:hypothetical protein [Bacillus xiapuensis]
MGLKTALFELKEAVRNQQGNQTEETYIQDLEHTNQLTPGSLIYYFNQLQMAGMNKQDDQSQTADESKKVNRKWSKNEIEFMFQYIKERQAEGALNITEILEELSDLFDRGYQSVNYKYYSLLKKEQKGAPSNGPLKFTTIAYQEVPVISAEIIPEASSIVKEKRNQDDDLLDLLSGLITNIQQLPGIQLNELLRSLYQLTNMALQNQEEVQQIEHLKTELNQEKEVLQQKLLKKEQQLRLEKQRNDELQIEVSKLAKEINAFNKLGDAAKIQNLKAYNQRLNYIIDGFGMVIQIGS